MSSTIHPPVLRSRHLPPHRPGRRRLGAQRPRAGLSRHRYRADLRQRGGYRPRDRRAAYRVPSCSSPPRSGSTTTPAKAARQPARESGETAHRPVGPGPDPLAGTRQRRRAGGVHGGAGGSQVPGPDPADRRLQLQHRADPPGHRRGRCGRDIHQPDRTQPLLAEPRADRLPRGAGHRGHLVHDPGLRQGAEGPDAGRDSRQAPGHGRPGGAGLGDATGLRGDSVLDPPREPRQQPAGARPAPGRRGHGAHRRPRA